jgi:protein ImuB
MFACIYSGSVTKSQQKAAEDANNGSPLVDLAFTFSPLVEQTAVGTVVLDVAGQDLLFGPPSATAPADQVESAHNLANAMVRRASGLDLKINVAVAANVAVAIHAARSFKGVTVIPCGEELSNLKNLSIKKLDHSLVAIDDKRAAEIQETFALWGIRTFGDLARLPLAGLAERLGQDGVRLQQLVQGKSDRRLKLVRPPVGFAQSLELEHAIAEVEPLSFILSRLLNQLCANLCEYALATNELKLDLKLQNKTEHNRAITLPVPMRNPKTLLRLLLFEIEREPPQAPIVAIAITAEPVKPRASQNGLFIPLAPEPERLEITLARLRKLVGVENVGSPEVLDTHRPDAFLMKKFEVTQQRRKNSKTAGEAPALPVMGFRIFRPPWQADVQTRRGQPIRITARGEQSSGRVHGQIVCASGPWRGSGDWWRTDVWARDEWDVAVTDPKAEGSEVLCRIYHDLTTERWFVAGIYD